MRRGSVLSCLHSTATYVYTASGIKTRALCYGFPIGRPFFCLSLLEQFSYCRFVIVISTFKNKSFHYILKSKTNDRI
ncbi:hypothetical protein EWV21_21890 [Escherichia coli]|nr:hypothetical protein [Escherichia coli]EEV6148828.1 hypothetical protein [Escherichia coli]EEW1851560.1 hypothetical protein [Escherichia coli]EEW2433494.1 hypothetical protein [Escherichia coli]EEY5912410.1 hypothetical protein [Escherichia coli]